MKSTKIIVLVESLITAWELRHAGVVCVLQLAFYCVMRMFDSGSLLFGIN